MKINLRAIILVSILLGLYSLKVVGQGPQNPWPLMPWPQNIQILDGSYEIGTDFNVVADGVKSDRLTKAVFRFLTRLDNRTGLFLKDKSKIETGGKLNTGLTIVVKRVTRLSIDEDESYELVVNSKGLHLSAETDFGVIRGLQTVLQLLSSGNGKYHIPYVNIKDAPRFKWRGLMIDASRHFQPMEVLKRNMDGMEAVKLNVLHLHLSDDQGFRVESKRFPKLHTMASDGLYYTHEQIAAIIKYADERGIRVVPEIDIPGHATALLTAYPQYASKDSTYQLVRKAGVFNATLNPTLDTTYVFLNELLEEMTSLFPDPYFHIGGDENEGKHWTENKNIQAFMKANDIENNHMLQAYFNQKVQAMLDRNNKKMIGWEEIQVTGLRTSATIHAWRGKNEGFELRESLFNAVKSGYDAILSDGYYIDRMNSIASHYLIDPLPEQHNLTTEQVNRVLGAEATMWSELVTPLTIDSRIWPRMAAIAERFWSPGSVNDLADMYNRLERVNHILESYGLTHIRNKEFILRNLTNGQNTQPLSVLVDVIEPLKGYTRNPNGDLYDTNSPFTLLADAAATDAMDAYKFNVLVTNYIVNNKQNIQNELLDYLNRWKNNHNLLEPIMDSSPILKKAEGLSINLSLCAIIGLEALNYMSNNETPTELWFSKASKTLESARQQYCRTELQVIEPIQRLVLHIKEKAVK